MSKTLSLAFNRPAAKTLTALIAIVAAVILPQIFHAAAGASAGAEWQPMYIPVIVAGFLAGGMVGITAGILSPIVSFAISGMPATPVLPFILIELAGCGLAAGLLSKAKLPFFIKLLLVQCTGILLKVFLNFDSITSITVGMAGIILQWVAIPLILWIIWKRQNLS